MALVVCTSCDPTNYFVKRIQIDSQLHIIPVGHRVVLTPDRGPFYLFFRMGTGSTTVSHWDELPGEGTAPKHLFYLETNRDDVLDRTVKTDEILSGPFGSVDIEKTCFFNRPVDSSYSSVIVRAGTAAGHNIYEIPYQLPDVPKQLPPLTSINIVRIFNHDTGYTIASANYEVDGELGSLNLSEPVAGRATPEISTTVHLAANDPVLLKYGIPMRIDLQGFLRSRRIPLPEVARPQVLVVVNLVYGFDQLIRQDTIQNHTVTSTRYLRPFITEEEGILNPKCDAHLQQQRSMRLPTVE